MKQEQKKKKMISRKSASMTSSVDAHRLSSSERLVDNLESRLREKVAIITGFGDLEMQARKLEQILRFYDNTRTGKLTYHGFFAAMTKFNFVGVQREIELLFNRYDDRDEGFVSTADFTLSLFGICGHVLLDAASKQTIDKIKMRILERNGGLGITKFIEKVLSMDIDGTKTVPRQELISTIREFGASHVASSDLSHLLDQIDVHGQVLQLLSCLFMFSFSFVIPNKMHFSCLCRRCFLNS